jgi:hypothetical protein
LPPVPVALPVVVAAAVSSEPPLPPELDLAVDDDDVLVALPPVPALVELSIRTSLPHASNTSPIEKQKACRMARRA